MEKKECSECDNTTNFNYMCDNFYCNNYKEHQQLTSDQKDLIIENNEIEKAIAKKKRNEAMNKYRLKDIEKWRERAKVLAKKLYDKNKNNPEYLAKKCESTKKSILRKKQQNEQNLL